ELGGLRYQPLYRDHFRLYCSANHALYHEKEGPDLLHQALRSKVVHAGIQTNSQVGEQLADMNKSAVSYFYEARLSMILSGVYIGFLPLRLVQDYLHTGQLKAICQDQKHYDLGVTAITRQHGKTNRARDLFLELLTTDENR
ncbi:MAG: LysR substrate-binding domain-containing protein, partial [Granulosicoccaceae bacterium]